MAVQQLDRLCNYAILSSYVNEDRKIYLSAINDPFELSSKLSASVKYSRLSLTSVQQKQIWLDISEPGKDTIDISANISAVPSSGQPSLQYFSYDVNSEYSNKPPAPDKRAFTIKAKTYTPDSGIQVSALNQRFEPLFPGDAVDSVMLWIEPFGGLHVESVDGPYDNNGRMVLRTNISCVEDLQQGTPTYFLIQPGDGGNLALYAYPGENHLSHKYEAPTKNADASPDDGAEWSSSSLQYMPAYYLTASYPVRLVNYAEVRRYIPFMLENKTPVPEDSEIVGQEFTYVVAGEVPKEENPIRLRFERQSDGHVEELPLWIQSKATFDPSDENDFSIRFGSHVEKFSSGGEDAYVIWLDIDDYTDYEDKIEITSSIPITVSMRTEDGQQE